MITIKIGAVLSEPEALALGQFLKRAGYLDYASHATSLEEAVAMVRAGEKIRDALRRQGYAPP